MSRFSPFSLISSPGEQTSPHNENPSVSDVKKFYDTMSDILETYERQWYLNIANYLGNQWLAYDKNSKRFAVPNAPSWRVRLVINKVMPIARAQMAKLHEVAPKFYVA